MSDAVDTLEALFNKVRELPDERRRLAIEALEDITSAPFPLGDDELRILRAALARGHAGEFASDDEVADLLGKPWG